jgi:protoporphyrinogen oxidase
MREKLGYLEGGSETLLQALSAAIKAAGGDIRLSMPVERVVIEHGKLKGVSIAGQATTEAFDRVISTIPLPFVPRMIPDLPDAVLAQYRSQANIAVVCVIAKLRKAVTPNFWLNINDKEMDIPGLVEYSNLRPLEHKIVYVPFYLPADHPTYAESDAAFILKVRRYIQRINPEVSDDDFIDIHASRYRYAQPICPPGFLEQLPPYQTDINGLWVADTSYYYPQDRGISESVEFGRRLAREACQ